MTFFQSIKTVFSKYATFGGRASRSEYWWFVLFNVLVSTALGIIGGGASDGRPGGLEGLWSLATLLPSIAVAARRLHDGDRSGWNQLWCLTIIGIFPVLYWLIQKGTDGPNRFGPDPLQQTESVPLVS